MTHEFDLVNTFIKLRVYFNFVLFAKKKIILHHSERFMRNDVGVLDYSGGELCVEDLNKD